MLTFGLVYEHEVDTGEITRLCVGEVNEEIVILVAPRDKSRIACPCVEALKGTVVDPLWYGGSPGFRCSQFTVKRYLAIIWRIDWRWARGLQSPRLDF